MSFFAAFLSTNSNTYIVCIYFSDPEWDFMKLLDDVEGIERDRATFECDVNDPEAEVKWFRNDKVCTL